MTLRRERIVSALADGETWTVNELAKKFDITGITIRRDLAELEREGKIVRTHGGAVIAKPSVVEFEFSERAQSRTREKRAIAQEAAKLIEPKMTVTIDTGTTTLEVAKALVGVEKLTVLTSSLAVASTLYRNGGVKLVLLGGIVRKDSPDMYGDVTVDNLRRFRVNLAILGADAITEQGFFALDPNVASVSRAMADQAIEKVVVADSSKFLAAAFARFAPWEEIDILVTDDEVPRSARRWLNTRAKRVIYVRARS